VPLDVGDYEKIAAMIGRVEAKIDAMRKDVVTTEMQALMNKGTTDDINDLNRRLTALENAPGKWLLYLGVVGSIILTLVGLLTHIKLLP
jgi:hypothetical protein